MKLVKSTVLLYGLQSNDGTEGSTVMDTGSNQPAAREEERLRALAAYKILDTHTERVFDDLARLASIICETPIALISFVDGGRQWFKSRIGLDAKETSREMSFCAHAIEGSDLFIVPDATEDDRFSDNPLVIGDPNIRFYAGAPLVVANGMPLGTLCVIDRKKRQLTTQQSTALIVLRQAVVSQLELRRALEDLGRLAEIIPMCAWCRDIKDSHGNWINLHDYVMSSERVSHGICPSCLKEQELS